MNSDIAPAVQVVAPEEGSTARLWTVFSILAGILCITAWMVFSSHVNSYHAGRRNEFPWPMPAADLLWLVGWLCGMTLLIVTSTAGRGAGRLMARGALVTCLAALPVGCYVSDLPFERHRTGFSHWVAIDVNHHAIRRWSANLPPAAAPVAVPAAQWPAELVALSPDAVEQMPGGVVVQWGRLSTWGNSRKVFVADDASVVPPPDLHHPWRLAAEGVWAAVQTPG